MDETILTKEQFTALAGVVFEECGKTWTQVSEAVDMIVKTDAYLQFAKCDPNYMHDVVTNMVYAYASSVINIGTMENPGEVNWCTEDTESTDLEGDTHAPVREFGGYT